MRAPDRNHANWKRRKNEGEKRRMIFSRLFYASFGEAVGVGKRAEEGRHA
jgi:hypothetical protein